MSNIKTAPAGSQHLQPAYCSQGSNGRLPGGLSRAGSIAQARSGSGTSTLSPVHGRLSASRPLVPQGRAVRTPKLTSCSLSGLACCLSLQPVSLLHMSCLWRLLAATGTAARLTGRAVRLTCPASASGTWPDGAAQCSTKALMDATPTRASVTPGGGQWQGGAGQRKGCPASCFLGRLSGS